MVVYRKSNLSPSQKIGRSFELVALRYLPSCGSEYAYRNTFSMLPPSSYPIHHSLGSLYRNWFWSDEVVNWFDCLDFLDPLQCETRIFRFRTYLCSESHSPALKFRVVREFSKMHFWCMITRVICHATLSKCPNTRTMVMRHRHRTISSVKTCWSCSLLKARHRYCFHWFSAFTLLNSFLTIHSRWCWQISWIITRFVRTLSNKLASKTFPEILISSRVFRSTSDSRLSFLLELEAIRGWCGTWDLSELLGESGSWNSFASLRKSNCSCNLLTWSRNTLTVGDSRLCCIEYPFNFCWLTSFSSLWQRLRNSSISLQLLAYLAWRRRFLNSNSPHKFILSRWAWSAHWLAWRNCNLWDSSPRCASINAHSEFFLSKYLISMSHWVENNFLLSWIFTNNRLSCSSFKVFSKISFIRREFMLSQSRMTYFTPCIIRNTGCFFGIGALVFEKVLISETRGPILRNRGPIQRNTVSLNRTAHSWAVLFSETVFLWIGPRIFYRENKGFWACGAAP